MYNIREFYVNLVLVRACCGLLTTFAARVCYIHFEQFIYVLANTQLKYLHSVSERFFGINDLWIYFFEV